MLFNTVPKIYLIHTSSPMSSARSIFALISFFSFSVKGISSYSIFFSSSSPLLLALSSLLLLYSLTTSFFDFLMFSGLLLFLEKNINQKKKLNHSVLFFQKVKTAQNVELCVNVVSMTNLEWFKKILKRFGKMKESLQLRI